MNKFTELVKKIREIFQIDRADLDFGIYRILNARSEEINQFLDKELQKRVKEALAGDNSEKLRQKKEELKAKEEHYRQDGVDPDSVPKIKELRQEIAGYMSENVDYENEVYSHLLRFFSRYYDKGDFISRRRYKADTYAVPYSGEEVVLHWANKDQYYIKSGEYFSNYSFNLDDGRRVTFKLVSADTAKDNRKDAEQNRLFVLAESHVRVREDDDGDEYEERIETIVESSDELVINFIYAPQPKGTKQGSLVKEALEVLFKKLEISKNWSALLERRPIDSNPARTLLEKQLTDYTEKNNADYFIHKDLGGFLRRELDFYIKSEVMNLDDIQHINTFKGIEKNLKMIQCLRLIAGHLIDFMAQLENFQKKLWLKKKFVVETNYCITLDRVSEEFYDEICKNEAQLEEWVKLFAIDEIEKDLNQPGFSRPLKKAFLRANDKLVLDTKFFSKSFKYRLISSIDNLDDQCNGLLIHSENFQALQFLQSSYKDSINCIYIDPPYNTDASKIIYKNGYEHSSWISLMLSRLELSKRLMSSKGIIEVAIDDYELRYINIGLEEVFGIQNSISNIAIFTNPKGRDQGFIAQAHDYTVIYAKDKTIAETNNFILLKQDLEKKFAKVKDGNSMRELPLKRTGTGKRREERPYMYFPFIYDPKSKKLEVVSEEIYEQIYCRETNTFNDELVERLKRDCQKQGMAFLLPISELGEKLRWRWGYKSCVTGVETGILFAKELKNGGYAIYQYDFADDEVTPKSMWIGERYDASSKGTNLLANILPNNPFDFPKSIYTVEDCIIIGSKDSDVVLDFFAGSGTTAHAIIELNRNSESANRKYILIEMGEHFDSVIIPRIKRVLFSPEWKKGKPSSFSAGFPHFCKYLKLESYEDTLNNLVLSRVKPQQNALNAVDEKVKNDYLLKYMLDVESRDSLLNTDLFKKPFDYTLDIATDSAGASEPRQVDLIETFNYLIGLKVQKLDVNPDQGLAIIDGETTSGENVLIIWRDCDKVDYQDLNKLCEKLRINPRDFEHDVLYVNGDHNIPQTITLEAGDGGITRTMKLRQIEDEFFRRMFACEEI